MEEADAGLALGVDMSGVGGKGEMPKPTVTMSDADKTSRGEGQIAGLVSCPSGAVTVADMIGCDAREHTSWCGTFCSYLGKS